MREEVYTKMTENLSTEVESIVLTQGKPNRLIISSNQLLFTIYEVRIYGIKWFALVAHEDAFKLLGEDKKDSGLLVIAHGKKDIIRELAKILVSFEDMEFLAA